MNLEETEVDRLESMPRFGHSDIAKGVFNRFNNSGRPMATDW